MQKKRHIIKNMAYVLHDVATYSKESIFELILSVLSKVGNALLGAIITYIVVDNLTKGTSPTSYLSLIAILCSISLIITCIGIWSDSRYSWLSTFARCSTSWIRITNKSITTDYENVEPRDKRKSFEKGFIALDNNWEGIEGLMKQVPLLLIGLLGMLTYLVIVAIYVPWVLFVMAGMVFSNVLLSIWANNYFAKTRERSEKYYTRRQILDNDLTSIDNAKDLRAYKLDTFFLKSYDVLTKELFNIEKNVVIHQFVTQLSDNIFALVRDLVAYSVLITMVSVGQIDVSTFSFLIAIIAGFSSWVNSFTDAYNKSRNDAVDVQNYRDALAITDQSNHGDGYDISKLQKPYEIRFDHVSFTYPGATKETLHDINLTIKPGEKIALVGDNGAGKTTFIKLLSGLYHPTKGAIYLNDVDITRFNVDDYFSLLSVLFQDIHPLAFDIETNVSCAASEDTDTDRFWKVVKEAGLYDKIMSLPKKEKTYITQTFDLSGILLSGGETQKMLLARALYKGAPLLLLDEPTSALDPLSEEEMYKQYLSFTKGNTSVFISHRLASTRFCDRILYMKNGTIEAEGSHKELLTSCHDYKEMFTLQAKYYVEATHD
jgi:ATP-binding cassette subfamily B protein